MSKNISVLAAFVAAVAVSSAIIVLPASLSTNQAFAHISTKIGNTTVTVGWVNEPTLVSQMNGVEVAVSDQAGKPVANALAETDIIIKKGGITKPLDFTPSETEGTYTAPVLPNQIGEYSVVISGKVGDQAIDKPVEVKLDDVQDLKQVSFPDTSGGSSQVNDQLVKRITDQLTAAISDLSTQVEQSNTSAQNAQKLAQDSINASQDLKSSADRAYIFGMVGLGIGAAGVIIGVIALSRKTQVV